MAYEFDVWRVSIIGTAFNGTEDWTTGFYVGHEDADAGVPVDADAAFIAARWQTMFTTGSSSGYFSANHKTTAVKITHLVAETGQAYPDNTVYSYYGTPISGAGNGNVMPAQCALAVTMTSSIPRGMASKGRMFLPGVVTTIDSAGKVASTTISGLATQMQTMFNGINTDLGIRGDVILASKGHTLPTVVTGTNKQVTGLKIGDVYDTQRRRRNGLVEVYTARSVTP